MSLTSKLTMHRICKVGYLTGTVPRHFYQSTFTESEVPILAFCGYKLLKLSPGFQFHLMGKFANMQTILFLSVLGR